MQRLTVVAMAVMATCLGSVVGRAFESVGPATGSILAGVAGLAAGVLASVRPEGTAGVTWRRLEIVAYPIVAVVVVAASTGETRLVPTVVAVGTVLVVRSLTESTVADLAMMERILDDRPTGAPPDRIRLRMLGVGVLLAGIAGYTVGVDAGFTDLSRSAVGGQLVAVVAWFGIGIAGVGVVSRRSRRRAWSVNDVEVDDGVSDRWAAGVAGAVVLVVVIALGAPFVTGQVSAAPARVISETDGLDRFVTRALELLSRDIDADQTDRGSLDDENRGSFTDALEPQAQERPDWIGDVVLTAIIATVFLWAIRAGRHARFRAGGRPEGAGVRDGLAALLAGLVSEVVAAFSALVRWLRMIGRRSGSGSQRIAGVGAPAPSPRTAGWSPRGAVERRIARAFSTVADLEPPRPGETPDEVSRRVGDRTDPAGARVVLGGYLRARYSHHRVDEATATDVEDAARRVTGAADHRAGADGNSGPGSEPVDG